jgi:hypothetical protein
MERKEERRLQGLVTTSSDENFNCVCSHLGCPIQLRGGKPIDKLVGVKQTLRDRKGTGGHVSTSTWAPVLRALRSTDTCAFPSLVLPSKIGSPIWLSNT